MSYVLYKICLVKHRRFRNFYADININTMLKHCLLMFYKISYVEVYHI